MPRTILLLLTLLIVQLAGCATKTATNTSTSAPLPDGRDLAEQPLDVLQLPQP